MTLTVPVSLLDGIKVEMSSRQKAIARAIEKTNFSNVRIKIKEDLIEKGKNPTDEYLDAGILALKQYYMICFLDDNPHAISRELDPFWHAHIICTTEYVDFSEKLGIGYMHHKPLIDRNNHALYAVRELYEHTIRVMNECFDYIDPRFYPAKVEDEELVCTHYSGMLDGTPVGFVQEGDNAFPRIPELWKLQHYN